MEFFGENLFKEKVFPEPLSKTFSDKRTYKESADLKKQTGCELYSNYVSPNLHFLCPFLSYQVF